MKMKIYPFTLVLVVLLTMGLQSAPGSDATEKSLGQAFDGIQKDLKDLSQSVTGLLKHKEIEFREKLDQSSQELNLKVEALEKKLAKMSDDSGEKLEKYVEDLKEKNAALTEKAKNVRLRKLGRSAEDLRHGA